MEKGPAFRHLPPFLFLPVRPLKDVGYLVSTLYTNMVHILTNPPPLPSPSKSLTVRITYIKPLVVLRHSFNKFSINQKA